MTAAAEELPPAPLPGYAPRLCTHGPIHYARRDAERIDRVGWRCVDCDLTWTTEER